MKCAPVCIVTLNRYDHLRQCLESLSRCTLAGNTDVFIALDYPPSEKYVDGWKKNVEFLDNCEDYGFKSFNVIKRNENYGIWNNPADKPTNSKALVQDILKVYDRYIFTEDDNVFLPCFLEYMNKGLELFENDEKVFSIAGYKFYYPIRFNENTFIRQDVDYSPWGVGLWKNKINMVKDIDYKWFRKNVSCRQIYNIKKKYGWGGVVGLLSSASKHDIKHLIDRHYWVFMSVMGLQQIVPTKTLVKNIGLDGSGETMSNAIGQEWCDDNLNPMSSAKYFDFIGTGYEFFEENRNVFIKGKYWRKQSEYMWISFKKIIKILFNR